MVSVTQNYIDLSYQGAAPDAPAAGKARFYVKASDGALYQRLPNGTEEKVGADTLAQLQDVSISNPLDRQTLIYNDLTSKFENGQLSLSDLSDVSSTNSLHNQYLRYISGQWQPSTPSISIENVDEFANVNRYGHRASGSILTYNATNIEVNAIGQYAAYISGNAFPNAPGNNSIVTVNSGLKDVLELAAYTKLDERLLFESTGSVDFSEYIPSLNWDNGGAAFHDLILYVRIGGAAYAAAGDVEVIGEDDSTFYTFFSRTVSINSDDVSLCIATPLYFQDNGERLNISIDNGTNSTVSVRFALAIQPHRMFGGMAAGNFV